MADIPRMLSAGYSIKELFDGPLLSCRVKDSSEARVAVDLCLTISEQFAATLCLVQAGFSTHAPILVRSMLEGLADLLNLVKDSQYLTQMRFENARNDAKLFADFAADPEMQQDEEAIATLNRWQAVATPARDKLAADGFRTQSAVDKFRRAGIAREYVAYRLFCSFAHNQLTTVLARHERLAKTRYHHDAPDAMIAGILKVAVNILRQAIATLPSFAELPDRHMEKAADEVRRIWTPFLQAT